MEPRNIKMIRACPFGPSRWSVPDDQLHQRLALKVREPDAENESTEL